MSRGRDSEHVLTQINLDRDSDMNIFSDICLALKMVKMYVLDWGYECLTLKIVQIYSLSWGCLKYEYCSHPSFFPGVIIMVMGMLCFYLTYF